ncbi:MAG TPA: helix-turn-helix domain-containing protein [Trueperaceae bacterium]|nr:helix-turn-helix domain-containing protein [Trueperaceae bacterium]
MTVRKKLQKLGNSRVLLLDRDLLAALLPDGDLDATLLVEVVGSALVVRREDAPAPAPGEVERAATAAAPDVPGLTPTERLVLTALRGGAATRGELAETIGRAPETVSAALKTLKAAELVTQTGRDWRLTATAKTHLAEHEPDPYENLPPAVARLCRGLQQGPATAAELEERLRVTRGAVLMATARAVDAGLVERVPVARGAPPEYRLVRSA